MGGAARACSRKAGQRSLQHASMTRSHVLSSLYIGSCTLTYAASSSSSSPASASPPPGAA